MTTKMPGSPSDEDAERTRPSQDTGASRSSALLQPVTEDARRLARSLLRSSREAALGVIRPSDGFPSVSRTLVATDFAGRPIILISGLSLHAKALKVDRRCSMLVGRSGKGDPLAHPRMTVFAVAEPLALDGDEGLMVRARFLARHPKAELYVDFPDFQFLRLEPTGASLNGGFARAYDLSPVDLIDGGHDDLPALAERARVHMNADHQDAIDTLATLKGYDGNGWLIATVDRRGFEIARSDQLERIEFGMDPGDDGGYRKAFVELMRPDEGKGGS